MYMKVKEFTPDIYLDISAILLALAYVVYTWEGNTFQVAGILIALISFSLWIRARLDLGESFSLRPEARTLVTTGLYAKIRNPMYVFGALGILGLLIAVDNVYAYPFFLILLVVQWIRVRKENKVLSDRFGKEYIDYKKQTWF